MMQGNKWMLMLTGMFLMVRPAAAEETWPQITKEYETAISKWTKELRQDGSENSKILLDDSTRPHPRNDFRPRVRKYAEQHEGLSDAIPALVWLVANEYRFPIGNSNGEAADWAIGRLARDHITDPSLKDHFGKFRVRMLSVNDESLISFLDAVVAKNPDRESRGWASLVTAVILSDNDLGLAYSDRSGSSTKMKRAEKIFRSLVEDYAGTDIADKAKGHLFVTDYLQVGMQVPETVGKDVDGNEISLSDFRGRVVMIAFWATWCVPCMQAIPYERELMKTHADKPFTVLGINVDESKSVCRKAIKKEGITWPNIHDGGHGGIATKWRIHSFPTVVMLDHNGVIRSIDREALDIDELLVAAVAAKKDNASQ